jgi:transposase
VPAPMAAWRSARHFRAIKSSLFLPSIHAALLLWRPAGAPITGDAPSCASGHEVRLIPPAYVKPFVRRQKNDAADAEAICEAAVRPAMRFVAVKTEEQQARAMLFRTRDLLVRQRTQLINALRGHLAEHGVVVPQGPANLKGLAEAIGSETTPLPLLVVELSRVFLDQIDGLSKTIAELEKVTVQEATRGATMRRLQTMPGVGPITAMAIETFAPPMAVFRRGRDFAAWLGLVPRQHSTAASRFSARPRRWASVTSGAC